MGSFRPSAGKPTVSNGPDYRGNVEIPLKDPPPHGYSAEYNAGLLNGPNQVLGKALLTGSGPYNYNQYHQLQYRPAANFGIGVYMTGAGVPEQVADYFIEKIGKEDKDSAEVIAQDKRWAHNGYVWAATHCRGHWGHG